MPERVVLATESQFIQSWKAARRVSTPLIAVATPDPAATVAEIIRTLTDKTPVIVWDIVRGVRSLNEAGKKVCDSIKDQELSALSNPTEALALAVKFPAETVFFFYNIQQYLDNPSVIQGCWNLRDNFKRDQRTLVMLTPGLTLPRELAQDVLVLDEPLPGQAELKAIVLEMYKAADLAAPEDSVLAKAIEALSGLSAFTAEQVTSMSMKKSGVDLSMMWERKRQTIEQTPGLTVWRGGETFDDIGGVGNVKNFLTQVLNGNNSPNCILFIDEIEKALAGGQGDTSGTSQEMLGTMLSWMQDNAVTGIIAIGPPGAAKSMIAKAAGATAGIVTVTFDLSGMKGSLVGESGKNLRTALKVVDAVSSRKVLCIATCNSIGALPPELRRRFTFGTFFFALPTAEERAVIWQIYFKKYAARGCAWANTPLPVDAGWTGAEIKQCCDLAYRLKCTLVAASQYIVPVSQSSAEMIDRLCAQASGRFISASEPGLYKYERSEEPQQRDQVIVLASGSSKSISDYAEKDKSRMN